MSVVSGVQVGFLETILLGRAALASRLSEPYPTENRFVWNIAANLTAQWAFMDKLQKRPLPFGIRLGPFRVPVLHIPIGKPRSARLADKSRIVILWSSHAHAF